MQITRKAATLFSGFCLVAVLTTPVAQAHPGHETTTQHPFFHLHGITEVAIILVLTALLFTARSLYRRLRKQSV